VEGGLFDFSVTEFAYDQEVLGFLQRQLEGHVRRLTNEFPHRFRGWQACLAVEEFL